MYNNFSLSQLLDSHHLAYNQQRALVIRSALTILLCVGLILLDTLDVQAQEKPERLTIEEVLVPPVNTRSPYRNRLLLLPQ